MIDLEKGDSEQESLEEMKKREGVWRGAGEGGGSKPSALWCLERRCKSL